MTPVNALVDLALIHERSCYRSRDPRQELIPISRYILGKLRIHRNRPIRVKMYRYKTVSHSTIALCREQRIIGSQNYVSIGAKNRHAERRVKRSPLRLSICRDVLQGIRNPLDFGVEVVENLELAIIDRCPKGVEPLISVLDLLNR